MTATSAPRVLVVDNEQRICELLDINLSRRGYHVRVVEGRGPQILDEAIAQAHAFRPHVAIIDLRLVDDFVDERSGLDLLPHLQSARCILFSANLISDVTLKAAREHNIFAWVDKYRQEYLYKAVERAACEACAELRDITIHWPASWSRESLVEQLFHQNNDIPHISILDDMVAQLFAENDHFAPQTVSGAVSGLGQVIRGRSIVMKIYPDELEPKVLKLGNAERIAHEQEQFQRYVKGHMASLHATQLENTVSFWDLGGAVYSFMGSSDQALPTFAMHYAAETEIAAITQPLAYFFNTVWHSHYTRLEPLAQTTLFDAYDEALGLSEQLPKIDRDLMDELHTALPLPWPDPVAWVKEFGRDCNIPSMRQAVTHGDFHGDNLFVDGDRAWIIDFERTGPGHVLRDFVELEVDIYTRLVDERQVDWYTLLELAFTLVDTPLAQSISPAMPLVQTNSAAAKALAVIGELRRSARALVPAPHDQREYLWAMLFDALFAASISSAPRSQRMRAMLLASVICEHLRTWGPAWPPATWQDALEELRW